MLVDTGEAIRIFEAVEIGGIPAVQEVAAIKCGRHGSWLLHPPGAEACEHGDKMEVEIGWFGGVAQMAMLACGKNAVCDRWLGVGIVIDCE